MVKNLLLCVLLVLLAGCIGQSYKLTTTGRVPVSQFLGGVPQGNAVATAVNDEMVQVTKECEAKASSWWSMTSAEKLDASITCNDTDATTVGVQGVATKPDSDLVKAATEGAVTGVMKGLGAAAGNPAAVVK